MWLERIGADDSLWAAPPFIAQEVLFLLMYRLGTVTDGLFLTDRCDVLLAQTSPEWPAWVWIAPGAADAAYDAVRDALAAHGIGRITATPEAGARLWPGARRESRQIGNHCPALLPLAMPVGAAGPPAPEEDAAVAGMLVGFYAFNGRTPHPPAEYRVRAARFREAGTALVWRDAAGEPVAFANQNGWTPRHITIGPVFTLPNHRGHGYAAGLVAAMSKIILAQGRTPALYTDGDYPPSNRCYAKAGFVPAGEVHTMSIEEADP